MDEDEEEKGGEGMSGRRQADTKAQWVRDNLPEEFHGTLGEVLAHVLIRADLEKLRAAIGAYGWRIAKEGRPDAT